MIKFKLRDGEKITIEGVNTSAKINIAAQEESTYHISFTDSEDESVIHDRNETGEITVGEAKRTFAFRYEQFISVPTGVDGDIGSDSTLLYAMLAVLAGLLIFEIYRKREKRRD